MHTVKLDTKTINLVKFFINNNIAIKALSDKYLRRCIGIKLGRYSFQNRILPSMMDFVKKLICEKLQRAEYVHIIVDLWSSTSMADFLALAVSMIYSDFKRETIVIGMERMEGRHTAENIKIVIEKIINEYDFDKSKVASVISDEGKNIMRLFDQQRLRMSDGTF